jgi:hypothetical protein
MAIAEGGPLNAKAVGWMTETSRVPSAERWAPLTEFGEVELTRLLKSSPCKMAACVGECRRSPPASGHLAEGKTGLQDDC